MIIFNHNVTIVIDVVVGIYFGWVIHICEEPYYKYTSMTIDYIDYLSME